MDPDADFLNLSGGLKRKTLLARALAGEPDVLFLDEPTNHLDVTAIHWLEEFLAKQASTLFFVTHDRMFLRRVAGRILEPFLFGFGLATMAHRRIETAVRAAESDLPPDADPAARERHLARVCEAAVVDARRLVRRRGLWMILFGAVHGTIFAGDIIGAYGIIATIFAGTSWSASGCACSWRACSSRRWGSTPW